MQIAILGRQSALSLAELESLYGSNRVQPIGDYAALIESNEPLPQARLGGTIKSAKLLTRLENTDLNGAFSYLQETIPEHLQYLADGKLQFGISVYGFKAQRDWLLRQMLSLKKIIKKHGRSVRIIENKSEALEAAQVLYNKLTGPLGCELLIIKDGEGVILAQTTAVQDINAYAARDQARPMRDARVGMLPPKLAQIIINLATGSLKIEKNHTVDAQDETYTLPFHILDPFCGTGVILQEGLLMGYSVLGSDIEPRMCQYASENIQWLLGQHKLNDPIWEIYLGYDATEAQWREFNAIATETYLGEPYSTLPDAAKLEGNIKKVNALHEKFLVNVATQTKPGFRMCLALPAWHLGNDKFKHLPILDHLADLGYNRLDLVHAKTADLLYYRENQIVARELTILVRS